MIGISMKRSVKKAARQLPITTTGISMKKSVKKVEKLERDKTTTITETTETEK